MSFNIDKFTKNVIDNIDDFEFIYQDGKSYAKFTHSKTKLEIGISLRCKKISFICTDCRYATIDELNLKELREFLINRKEFRALLNPSESASILLNNLKFK